jgi:hypothetical protein
LNKKRKINTRANVCSRKLHPSLLPIKFELFFSLQYLKIREKKERGAKSVL